MNNYLRSALEILRKAEGPMHYKDITDKAIDEGLLETTGRTPSQTMNHYLRKYGEYFTDKKGKKGEYSLKITTKEINSIIKKEEEKEELDIEIETEKNYIGQAGEYFVCSELINLGFNTALSSVDRGIDIIGIKDNKLIKCQVKSARLNKDQNKVIFNIPKKSFQKHRGNNVYYTFVIRDFNENITCFIIRQKTLVKYLQNRKAIKSYSIGIFKSGKRYYLSGKEKIVLTPNNWRIIEN